MTIRWRLVVFILQLFAIGTASQVGTGKPWSSGIWFAALIAYAAVSQLQEPFYSRPVDVLANGVLAFVLILLAKKEFARPGWIALGVVIAIAVLAAAIASVAGAQRDEGRFVPFARASRIIATSLRPRTLYTAVFWLGLVEYSRGVRGGFWSIAAGWMTIAVLAAVNWQAAWAVARRRPEPVTPAGLVGPARLLVSGPDVPAKGSRVRVLAGTLSATGTVLSRIRRMTDVWAEINVDDGPTAEKLLASASLTIEAEKQQDALEVLGAVEAGSSHEQVVFSPTRSLRVGEIVSVSEPDGDVLYQISRADVVDVHVKGGAQLDIRARAFQIGRLDSERMRLARHRWVAGPGASIVASPTLAIEARGRFLLGHLIGTEIPLYLDCELLDQSHMAILGMTRMGKTTLARRLAERLGQDSAVVVMDQTGEYRSKAGYTAYNRVQHDSVAGVSVFEPQPAGVAPDEGLEELKHLANKGFQEFTAGTPFPRVLLVDEAHQFVPEPAVLGFNAPGRESAIKFGMYAMQVRKYGLTLILISQRTAVLAKSALSQCENVIAFKSVDQTGLDYLESVVGPAARDVLPTLGVGEALVSGPAMSADSAVAVTLLPGPAALAPPVS